MIAATSDAPPVHTHTHSFSAIRLFKLNNPLDERNIAIVVNKVQSFVSGFPNTVVSRESEGIMNGLSRYRECKSFSCVGVAIKSVSCICMLA